METASDSGISIGTARRAVLVVDDHRMVAQMIALGLDAHPSFLSVGVVCDYGSALEEFRRAAPDVVVVDVHLDRAGSSGLDLAAALVDERPDVAVVLLTGDAHGLTLEAVSASGACALLGKGGSLESLLEAIDRAEPGRLEVDPRLLRDLAVRADPTPPVSLTSRERQVLGLLSEGLDVARICQVLAIRPHTCRGYVKSLLHKLDAHTQLEAVAQARRRGLL